jgi:hypothetical protein
LAAENILRRESIMQKLEVFERAASDPARHFRKHRDAAARDAAGNAITRVTEAKARAKYHTQLADVEAKLMVDLNLIYTNFGDIVTFEGKPYQHKMVHDRQEMLYWLEQERRHTNISKNTAFALPPLMAPAVMGTAIVVNSAGPGPGGGFISAGGGGGGGSDE